MSVTIGEYLIDRLAEIGVRHVFGVPGDFVLGFYKLLDDSRLTVVNTADEQGAGFAADAYARINGIGAVCITYSVGGFKVANPTAQAYAERSPVVVISGAPGTNERTRNPLLHHKVKGFDTQLNVFREFTVAVADLSDPQTAFAQLDRALAACLKHKRPVYIELPRDMVQRPGVASYQAQRPDMSDADTLEEALREALDLIESARQPVIIAGEELHRFGLQSTLSRLIDRSGFPVAATTLSKSILPEDHPRYLGVYEGAMAHESVRSYVESSDCLLLLGANLSDVTLGINTAHIDVSRSIYVTADRLSVRRAVYEGVLLADFLGALAERVPQRPLQPIPPMEDLPPFVPVAGKPITVARMFQAIDDFLDDRTIVIAEAGDALFGGLDLRIRHAVDFLAPAYYLSLGFGVPAAIGAQMADPNARPLVLSGDGAFQMTGMELSTVVRYGLNPIVVVLNNSGYGTERPMLDGSFNDITNWNYSAIPSVLGQGHGFVVRTEDEMPRALQEARARTDAFSIIDVHLERGDLSPALQRLTEFLGKRVT